MKKLGLEMTDKVSGHIESFLEINEQYWNLYESIENDLSEYLHRVGFKDEKIDFVQDIVHNIFDKIRLIDYLTNEEDKEKEDVLRQAYVIADEPIPFYRETPKAKIKLSKEQIKEFDALSMPYSIKELKNEDDEDTNLMMTIADSDYLNKLAKKSKDKRTKELVKIFENEFMPEVPIKDVKELHVYFPDYDEDLLFLDEEGLHKVVGKKAKIEFMDGTKKVGYLGSDFKDQDGDDCLGLFEAYDDYKGFYDYHIYKIKDLLRGDVLYYPRESINFSFDIKVRDINKVTVGMTEKKETKKKIKDEN